MKNAGFQHTNQTASLLSSHQRASFLRLLETHVQPSLAQDISSYARGRSRCWLRWEGPLSQSQDYRPGLNVPSLWNEIESCWRTAGLRGFPRSRPGDLWSYRHPASPRRFLCRFRGLVHQSRIHGMGLVSGSPIERRQRSCLASHDRRGDHRLRLQASACSPSGRRGSLGNHRLADQALSTASPEALIVVCRRTSMMNNTLTITSRRSLSALLGERLKKISKKLANRIARRRFLS